MYNIPTATIVKTKYLFIIISFFLFSFLMLSRYPVTRFILDGRCGNFISFFTLLASVHRRRGYRRRRGYGNGFMAGLQKRIAAIRIGKLAKAHM